MNPKEKTLIAGLGRGLIVKSTHCDTVGILTCVDFFTNYVDVTENKELYALRITQYKPYLRDLSDLDEVQKSELYQLWLKHELRGDIVTNQDIFYQQVLPNLIDNPLESSYYLVEKLHDWHFNVFNLPESKYIKVTPENNPY